MARRALPLVAMAFHDTGVCITAGSVVSNRQARAATLAVLLREIGEFPNGKGPSRESTKVTRG